MRLLYALGLLLAGVTLSFAASARPDHRNEWPAEIPPGALMGEVQHYLLIRGVKAAAMRGVIPTTTKLISPERDYLFCQDRLYSIVDGARVDGVDFNYWMTLLLSAKQEFGSPKSIELDELWRQIKITWSLPKSITLYYLIRGAPPETIIWSREFRHLATEQPCRRTGN